MSKSKGNIIDIFLPEKELKKQVMAIQTDSTPIEDPKNFKSCNVYKIFKLIADNSCSLFIKLMLNLLINKSSRFLSLKIFLFTSWPIISIGMYALLIKYNSLFFNLLNLLM